MKRRTCSWCHTSNVLDAAPILCGACGHRADVARLDCNCAKCVGVLRQLPAGAVQGRVYFGVRTRRGATVTRDGITLSPLPSQAIRNHSPDGFEWGYSGSGPAQLALAILLDVTGDRAQAERLYQRFKERFVASWESRWILTEGEVRGWLRSLGEDADAGVSPQGPPQASSAAPHDPQ